MSSYLCIKITKTKADICFAQKDVNLFFFFFSFFFTFRLVKKIKAKKKKKKKNQLNRAILSSLGKNQTKETFSIFKKIIYYIYIYI